MKSPLILSSLPFPYHYLVICVCRSPVFTLRNINCLNVCGRLNEGELQLAEEKVLLLCCDTCPCPYTPTPGAAQVGLQLGHSSSLFCN